MTSPKPMAGVQLKEQIDFQKGQREGQNGAKYPAP